MSNHQDEYNKMMRESLREALAHQKRVAALALETAELNREKAAVELRIQEFIETHVHNAEKAAELRPWTSSGKASS